MRSRVELPTNWGTFTAVFTANGLAQLYFPGVDMETDADSPPPQVAWVRQTTVALRRALTGKPSAPLPPLDWPAGATPFQRAVWEALLRIPPGNTLAYGQLAEAIGRPRAARAVGQACGANPIPVLVPCHRVVAGSGALGGFSGGLDWKRRLLAAEGMQPARGR
jgi:O-6-methylguanine DNA methyltransferase